MDGWLDGWMGNIRVYKGRLMGMGLAGFSGVFEAGRVWNSILCISRGRR